jgi:Rne/Rng family ribonuclease
MSKELFISSTPHETKIAIVEEDQLVEIQYERENEYTLAGSIYKGRVTRVLPGMQSAFVEIGLERDAFLYVTDFFEQGEEDADIETLPAGEEPSERENGRQRHQAASTAPMPMTIEGGVDDLEEEPAEETSTVEGSQSAPQGEGAEDRGGPRRWRGRRRRGRRGRGDDRPERQAATSNEASANSESGEVASREMPREIVNTEVPRVETPRIESPRVAAPRPVAQSYEPIILPGESLGKYRRMQEQAARRQAEAAAAPVEAAPETPAAHEPFRVPVVARPSVPEVHEDLIHPDGRVLMNAAEYEARMQASSVAPRVERHHDRDEERHEEPVKPMQVHGAGVVEEEEIEEEDSDIPSYMQSLEDESYDDLEEETLDRLEESNGRTLIEAGADVTEAVREAHVEERANDEYEAVDSIASEEPGDEEFSEETADNFEERVQASPGNESDEPGEARAEVRGPSGIQPRVAPGREGRRERGRDRGGDRNRDRRGGRRGGRPSGGGPRRTTMQMPQISDLLKEGQEILVQIAKEPIGKKGARITSHIALPGRYLVYMPTVNHNGVSRKIASDEERMRLRRIIASERANHSGGFIVRTAAAGVNEDELRADIRFLLNLWTEIKQRSDNGKAPALIYHDLNLVERILRDQLSESYSHVWVDTEAEYERILRFVSRFQPQMVKRVKLYTKETPLFEQFNIQDEINKALKSKVWLKSGGYIVINQTEALVAIDINTGKYVGKTQRLEDTITRTNVEAIKEIVRQIRLRDLGGIIVIDFIDMDERKNRQRVMQELEQALKADRQPSKVLQFNDFGLVAITRKRVKQSLERTLGSPCTYCTGTGLIKSVSTICNEIYVEMRKMAKHFERQEVILRVNPEVAKALKANNARWLLDLEEISSRSVIVKSDPTLHQEQFDVH